MSIRNATIAMRNRKSELMEQERTASRDYDLQRRGGVSNKSKKKAAPHPKNVGKANAQHNAQHG